ncbi:MAG: CoB--CoM heterodisulfide reductase iron-sulfur subunit A family protein [Bacteroidales bacterium]|nr:CoB--CoM heterodisulfide reductase iron-sulfur subunit A family protein [Bacteroidales bacterium]
MNKVVVIGGGVAGMEAAGHLARTGYEVTLLEKESDTGGHVKNWFHLFPDRKDSREVLRYMNNLINHQNISLYTGVTVEGIEKMQENISVRTDDGNEISADAVVVATGFDLFRSERKEEYGYGIYENVITSEDLERMFRKGEIRLANGSNPEKTGFIHCVGSRDEKVGNLYCSKLCCITAVKQAIEIKKHIEKAKVFCFYMDMRMGGAMYEELYREAQENYGVSFIRGKVSEVAHNINGKLIAKVEDTLTGRPLKMELDMLVLMAGMEMSESGRKIAESSGLLTGENRFFKSADLHFGSNISNIKGVFYAGTCTAPMTITEAISHARGAVFDVMDFLNNKG